MDRKWSKDLKEYELYDGDSIERADWKDFSIYFAIYEIFETNTWFRQSFDSYCSILKDCDICFWIKKNGCRIGGVLLKPNYMNCLFLEPPYNEYDIIISKLKSLLLIWSHKSESITVGCVKPDKLKYYQRAGFKMVESRRCMIRPTEKFEIDWDEEYRLEPLTKEKIKDISKLFAESYRNGIGDNGDMNFETQSKSFQYYFEHNPEGSLINKASTLVYERETNELIGAALISIWEEWPNVYEIAVKPSFQNNGLAQNMLKRALTVLKEGYPVLRLFVTLGNNAEMVYHKLGFLAGTETTEMELVVSHR